MLGIYLRKMKDEVELLANDGLRLKRAGEQIDRQGQDHCIEKERENTVDEGHSPHRPRRHLDVRHLTGHADYEGEIEEIPIVRLLATGKGETTPVIISWSGPVAIIVMGVMQREHRMGHCPRRDHGQAGESEARTKSRRGLMGLRLQSETQRDQAYRGRCNDDRENDPSAR